MFSDSTALRAPYFQPMLQMTLSSIHPSFCPSVCVCVCVYVCMYVCMCLSVCLSIYLSIYLSVRPSIHPSIHPCVCVTEREIIYFFRCVIPYFSILNSFHFILNPLILFFVLIYYILTFSILFPSPFSAGHVA
jgi:hypothetical protein